MTIDIFQVDAKRRRPVFKEATVLGQRETGDVRRIAQFCSATLVFLAFTGGALRDVKAENCPTTSNGDPQILFWQENYNASGVTLCVGIDRNDLHPRAYVQIVDFEAGARMRIMHEVAPGSAMGAPNTLFQKRTAQDWYDWVSTHVADPHPCRLFSTTNASYFTSTSGSTSPLSFPAKKWNGVMSLGQDIGDNNEKRILALGDPRQADRQQLFLADWGEPDNTNDPTIVAARLNPYFDAVVGYHPDVSLAQTHRRTFVGTRSTDGLWLGSQDRAYILTTNDYYTVGGAKNILVNDFHTQWNIELDGGGSTQFFVDNQYGYYLDALTCPFCRTVPDVLVVYQSNCGGG